MNSFISFMTTLFLSKKNKLIKRIKEKLKQNAKTGHFFYELATENCC